MTGIYIFNMPKATLYLAGTSLLKAAMGHDYMALLQPSSGFFQLLFQFYHARSICGILECPMKIASIYFMVCATWDSELVGIFCVRYIPV